MGTEVIVTPEGQLLPSEVAHDRANFQASLNGDPIDRQEIYHLTGFVPTIGT
jgi:hypothetical protein